MLDLPRYFLYPDEPVARRLRGAQVFSMWRELGHEVHDGSGAVEVTLPAALFIAVSTQHELVDFVQQVGRSRRSVVIVDVPFPLLRPDLMVGSREALELWTTPEHQRAALRAVRAADAVTTPWAEWNGYPDWLDDLAEHNPNVTVLPDMADDDIGRFADTLLRLWRTAKTAKATRSNVI